MGRKELIAVAKVVLLLMFAVFLQTVLLSHISILGVTADLFVILTVIVAVSKGSLHASIFGFFAGLMADIAYYQPLGVRALIYVLAGYFVGMFVARFGTVTPWSVDLVAGVTSFLAQFVFGLLQFAMGPRGALFSIIGTQMVPEAVLDGLITAPLYVFLVRVRLVPAGHLDAAGSRGGEE
jgi:rod shape-determining protein MreD